MERGIIDVNKIVRAEASPDGSIRLLEAVENSRQHQWSLQVNPDRSVDLFECITFLPIDGADDGTELEAVPHA